MEEFFFQVQGSSDDPYEVHFMRQEDGNVSAYCTCTAGFNGQYCKHRFTILEGIGKGLVSSNEQDVAAVAQWLPGSNIQEAMDEITHAEEKVKEAKKVLSAAKKALAKTMRD